MNIEMLKTSITTLRILATLTWYTGGIILVIKAGSLLNEAYMLKPGYYWTWLAIGAGLLIGGLKARYLFVKSCLKNLQRIDSLTEPQLWQFFRPGFFLFLTVMIATGVTLSKVAHNNYILLTSVAILDISIATALLGSSFIFWKPQKKIIELSSAK